MNIIDLAPSQKVIAQLHEAGCPLNEFPARFIGTRSTDAGTPRALFVFQPHDTDVWHHIEAHALTTSGPWAVGNMLLTVRAEQYVTVTGLAEQVAWDHVATDEIEHAIIAALGMDPRFANGATLLDEDQAERAANEITVTA